MSGTEVLTVEELDRRVEGILRRAGLNEVQAGALARVIVAGERDACTSHGIYRIDGILRTIKAGKVNPLAVPELLEQEGSGVVRVNARGGFANAAVELGAPVLAARARRLGVAALVVNDCTHFSALWPEVEMLTGLGVAALVMCPSYSTVAPTGGNRPLLGTNPLAFGWPRPDGPPYVFDFATSVTARGEVELHRQAGKPLPEGWAIDAEGRPTTDPAAALAGAMLPFGGHKGSAIGTMIELLAGIMIGDLTSEGSLAYLGSTTLAPAHGELVDRLLAGGFRGRAAGGSVRAGGGAFRGDRGAGRAAAVGAAVRGAGEIGGGGDPAERGAGGAAGPAARARGRGGRVGRAKVYGVLFDVQLMYIACTSHVHDRGPTPDR